MHVFHRNEFSFYKYQISCLKHDNRQIDCFSLTLPVLHLFLAS